ncbi:MAG: PKD domain-containing protein [Aquincola sp.]|nr:PKD domain-containing protein [Aquincola sp.]
MQHPLLPNAVPRLFTVAAVLAFALAGCGGGGDDAAPQVQVMPPTNTNPVANAGASQSVMVGATVLLDGGASSDADGDALTFTWTLTTTPGGSQAVLSAAGTATPSFVADVAGTFVASLVVRDGKATSASSTVTINAASGNTTPLADAGPAQSVLTGATVSLDGGASIDADGDTLAFAWTLTARPAGSQAVLDAASTATPSFVADVAGTYVASLAVSDGQATSAASTVTINASSGNTAPVAHAGTAQSVLTGATVTLNGGGSTDVDGDPLTYAWTLTTRPAGSAAVLSNANAVAPTFVADVAGSYVATLVVNDGKVNSAPATVTISAAVANAAPTANAGPAQNVGVGTLVTLDGRASSDPNGDAITFAWTLSTRPAGSVATLSNPTAAQPTFTPDVAGTYIATLVVSDGVLDSTPATVTITAAAGNSAPVANAGPDKTVFVNDPVTIDGSGSFDADGDALTFNWSVIQRPSGSSLSLSASNTATPRFTANTVGTYVLQLIVNDGQVSSNPDTVTISVVARP